jgi:hypothetical protein
LIRREVKQLATWLIVSLSIFSCDAPEAATSAAVARRCEAIVRPTRSVFVQIAADGAMTRRHVLRPACALVGARADSTVSVDETGAKLSAAGHEITLAQADVDDGACLGRVRVVRDGFVLVGGDGAWRYTAAGRSPQPLPPGVLLPKFHGLRGSLFVVDDELGDARFVDVTGAPLRPLFIRPAEREAPSLQLSLDDEAGAGVPSEVIAASRDGDAGIWTLAPAEPGGRERFVVRLPGRSITVEDAVLLRDRVIVPHCDRVDELRADGADRARIVLRPDVDAAGVPLGENAREVASFHVDGRSGQILVVERVRSPDCSIDDRMTLVGDDGRVRGLGLAPAMRSRPSLVDGVVSFVESEVAYEAFNDDSGTNLP